MDMDFEDFHRLPVLNVRLNDVTELSMRNFHLFERETLNGFLENFPNLRTLNLQDVDLRLPNENGNCQYLSAHNASVATSDVVESAVH